MFHYTFALRNLFVFFKTHQEQTPQSEVSGEESRRGHSRKSSLLTRLFGNGDHLVEKDGSHDPRQCKECVELDLVIQRLPENRTMTELDFGSKYKLVQRYKTLGKGAEGVVKLAKSVSRRSSTSSSGSTSSSETTPISDSKLVAVKEFKKRPKNVSLEEYVSRLTDEFRTATRLHHNNIVETIDIARYHRRWYEVMEYCSGGDLCRLLQKRSLSENEINCCFRQLVEGVRYLHSQGVAHRDLKLENMLLDSHGTVKIGDFGSSHVFRANKYDSFHKARGVCGSMPYIAPEEFTQDAYDARAADVWSLGIIYFVLNFESLPWKMACITDHSFRRYLSGGLDNIGSFGRLPPGPKRLLTRILEPDPAKRITLDGIFKDPWFAGLKLCPMVMKRET